VISIFASHLWAGGRLGLLWGALVVNLLAKSTEELAAGGRGSLVTLSAATRGGAPDGGVGTGFAVATNLIATSLHVIGEGRAITVKLADGTTVAVEAIEAWDRRTDLAVLRVAAPDLPPLALGDDRALEQGADVIALGNPLGLERSVVAGVLSARREVEGVEMLQLALPVEPGNSGGPLLDRDGRVVGIINSKSALTRNLGFATPASRLQTLLTHRTPMPYHRWQHLGELPPETWATPSGAHWRMKGGRILVDGFGPGFGGRAWLYQSTPAPAPPYELSVRVRLNDEAGAAGLVFAGDDERHWGFYPTGGQLRLTEFAGPEVFSWRIIGTKPVAAYQPGDWNLLRVRVETDRVQCWVNDVAVYAEPLKAVFGQRFGLAKFRTTEAQFRDFIVRTNPAAAVAWPAEVLSALGDARPPHWTDADLLPLLKSQPAAGRRELSRRARELETEAVRLRAVGQRAHRETVREELVKLLAAPEAQIDLVRGALLLAGHDPPDLDGPAYLRQFDRLAEELRTRLPSDATAAARWDGLRAFLFTENGFHGSRQDYENPANSYINDVLDDREGLPITLSVVCLELARRIGLEHVFGVPLPGHFVVKFAPPGADPQLFDPFDGGRPLTLDDADAIGSRSDGLPVRSEFLEPATPRTILLRMLNNLAAFAERSGGTPAALPYQDLLVAAAGDPRAEGRQRLERARLRERAGDPTSAASDLRWILEQAPTGMILERVREWLVRLGE